MERAGIFTIKEAEEMGLSSHTIGEALATFVNHRIQMHSFLVARNTALVCEAYWRPYGREDLHRMYSVTKSFVSLAIGILVDQGAIGLDDRIIDYFPEKLPAGRAISPYLAAVTIRTMLMMASCHRGTTYKEGSRGNYIGSFHADWVGSFFTVEPSHEPGMVFQYDTSSSHVLGALVERVSGMALVEFLHRHLFSKIGVSDRTYFLQDPSGVSVGGSGLMMRPIDLLAVARVVADGGAGYISTQYIEAATRNQIQTTLSSSSHSTESRNGYGYQFWRTSRGGWAMVGMGGQMAISVPEKDLLFVVTADTQGRVGAEEIIMDAVWKIVDDTADGVRPAGETAQHNLRAMVGSLALPCVRAVDNRELEQRIDSKTYHFGPNNLGLRRCSLTFAQTGTISLAMDRGDYVFTFGIGENIVTPLPTGMESAGKAASSGGWVDDSTVAVTIQFLGPELGSLLIQASFIEDRMTILLRLNGELSFEGFDGLCSAIMFA